MSVRYLLDTNAASYAINKKSAAIRPSFGENADGGAGDFGGDGRRTALRSGAAPLLATVEQFLLAVTVFRWDSEAAEQYGELRATLEREGRLTGSLDMMIAAHATALGLILITNDRAFGRIKKLKTEGWTK